MPEKSSDMRQIITHFTDNDLYTFSCQYYIMQQYPRAEVEYTFFDRNNTCYPKGFDKLLQEQINFMAGVQITDQEVDFMTKHLVWLPIWYFSFLRGYRFNPAEVAISQDEEGHLSIKISGKWFSTIMWEMPILSCISELVHTLNGDVDRYDLQLEHAKAIAKSNKIFEAGLTFGDMGTRRRFSFDHQGMVLKAMKQVYDSKQWPGVFTGTSNVWFAMRLGLKPLGTLSHQIISFEEIVSGVFECNYNVMKKFSDVYDGNNGIYLYDCFGDNVFFKNLSKRMAMMYSGLRVDSGIEEEQIDNGILYNCEKYHVPYVLCGSIRDDGPLPPVYADVYEGQNAMRDQIRNATTVICMATALHTIATSYFPLDNSAFFNDCDLNLLEWLAQYTADNAEENTESFKRSFLGRMLFSGDDVFKPVKVLSGGEKVRCMLSRMMLFGSNVLVLDQPTNHLDLESITAVNNGLIDFKGVELFSSHDHEFVQTIANRIMEFVDGKLIDKMCTYDEYIAGERDAMIARLNG